MANAFQLADPNYAGPQGVHEGAPTVPATVTDIAGSQTLHTVGWRAGAFRVLCAGDQLQLGYRLHMVCDDINADSSGHAAIPVWPSLREAPTASAPILLAKPKGLFCLAQNKRGWSTDYTRFSEIQIPIMEYR